jgi:hypothetical protein
VCPKECPFSNAHIKQDSQYNLRHGNLKMQTLMLPFFRLNSVYQNPLLDNAYHYPAGFLHQITTQNRMSAVLSFLIKLSLKNHANRQMPLRL